ncbi:anthranilate synthase component I [Varunaivibrio sulfuroxidans]|uniref:Anthranilate synthase component 1 n=1 Tax=Varunaivibrio sulfuroxidans TaxID=1773489 RepID=A0A4R3JDQ4_9PROT|nr:anthranilate synthase component I [Varunaivibrio sulfuroxidans]TCS64189.1 anthranilate synthase component I [Varunaivibrio sulfuroxidans]WES31366.1 anthranilate synthase component I [Varunaivibrio sulfuroxidans]
MDVTPEFRPFEQTYAKGSPQVVWTTLIADMETPVSAMLKLSRGEPGSFLFESVEGGAIRGRYSFIGLRPDTIWRCFGDRAEINTDPLRDPDAFNPCPIAETQGAIQSLRALLAASRIDLPDDLPPMSAGLVGYMSYDTVRLRENLPDGNPDVIGVPDGLFVRPTVVAVFDSVSDILSIVTPVRPRDGVDAQTAYDEAQDRLARAVGDFERSLPPQQPPGEPDSTFDAEEPQSNMTRSFFHDMVERAKEYILAGDIFQVVLSQRFRLPFKLPPFAFYRALRRINPSPFLFFLDFGDFSVIGSSPEILVRVREGKVTVRPIAGTRPRGQTHEEDARLERELLADPKELSEHLMLLDLGRNDVGRVAQIGSVTVTEEMIVERYSHVMHIVSNVEGSLDERFDALDALFAGFPAGTVSGAPKVRAMQIIDELEPEKRGIYAGCIGYFGANGDMDTCIALRTAVHKNETLYIQAGGGVVADSSPEGEYQESRNKARALLRAAEEAIRFASKRN